MTMKCKFLSGATKQNKKKIFSIKKSETTKDTKYVFKRDKMSQNFTSCIGLGEIA